MTTMDQPAPNYKCKICNHVTGAHNSMLAHIKKHHGKSGEGITAEFIEKTFEKAKRKINSAKGVKYICKECGHITGTDAGIIGHIKAKHNITEKYHEHYEKKGTAPKRKYTKREKPAGGNIMELLGGAKNEIKCIVTVDLEVNLTTNSIKIIPRNTEE